MRHDNKKSWFSWMKWENAPQIATAFFTLVGAYFLLREVASLLSENVALENDINTDFENVTDLVPQTPDVTAHSTHASSTMRHLLLAPVVVNPTPDVTMTEGRAPVELTLNASHIFQGQVNPLLTVLGQGGAPLASFISANSPFQVKASVSMSSTANNPYSSGDVVSVINGLYGVHVFNITNPAVPFEPGSRYLNSPEQAFDAAISGSEIAVVEANSNPNTGLTIAGPLLGNPPGLIKRLNVPYLVGNNPNKIAFDGGRQIAYLAGDTDLLYIYDTSVAAPGCSAFPCSPTIRVAAFSPTGTTIAAIDLDTFDRNQPISYGGYVWTAGNRITRIDYADAIVYISFTPPVPAVGIKATPTAGPVKPLHVIGSDRYFEVDDDLIMAEMRLVGSVMLPPSAGAAIDVTVVNSQYALVACANEMVVIDRSDPANPSIFATAPITSAQGIAAAGNSVLLAKTDGSFDTYDFSALTSKLRIAPGIGDTGVFPVEITGTNSLGENATDTLVTTVLPETAPTVTNPFPDQVYEVGNSEQLQLYNPFSDINGDEVTVTSVTEAGRSQLPSWVLFGNWPTYFVFPAKNHVGTFVLNVTGRDNSPYALTTSTFFQVTIGFAPQANQAFSPPAKIVFDRDGTVQSYVFKSNLLLVDGKPDPTMTFNVTRPGGGPLSPWLSANGLQLFFNPTKLPLSDDSNQVPTEKVVVRGTTSASFIGETAASTVTAEHIKTPSPSLVGFIEDQRIVVGEKFSIKIAVVPNVVVVPPGMNATLEVRGTKSWMKRVKTTSTNVVIEGDKAPITATDDFADGIVPMVIKVNVAGTEPVNVKFNIKVGGTSLLLWFVYVLLMSGGAFLALPRGLAWAYNRLKEYSTSPESRGSLPYSLPADIEASKVRAFAFSKSTGWKSRFLCCFFTGRKKFPDGSTMPPGVVPDFSREGKVVGLKLISQMIASGSVCFVFKKYVGWMKPFKVGLIVHRLVVTGDSADDALFTPTGPSNPVFIDNVEMDSVSEGGAYTSTSALFAAANGSGRTSNGADATVLDDVASCQA